MKDEQQLTKCGFEAMRTFLILTIMPYLIGAAAVGLKYCDTSPNPSKWQSIIKTTNYVINFSLPDVANFSSFILQATFSWTLQKDKDLDLDGFIVCFKDYYTENFHSLEESVLKEEVGEISSQEGNPYGYPLNECANYLGRSFWMTDQNGIYSKCRFPCVDLLNNSCIYHSNNPCYYISLGCRPVAKSRRNITLDVEFGKTYEFNVYPYKKHLVMKRSVDDYLMITDVLAHCHHQLIDIENINRSAAYSFCGEHQHFIGSSSGPISNFTATYSRNFIENRTEIDIAWRRPLDLAPGGIILEYLVSLDVKDVVQDTYSTEGKSVSEEFGDPIHRYRIKANGIFNNLSINVQITPYVNRTEEKCHKPIVPCVKYGKRYESIIFIPGFNPCSNTSNFCDPHASCHPPSITTKLQNICSCSPGYVGNGIDMSMDGIDADGCRNFNACSEATDKECASNANCVDADPPSFKVSSCKCKQGYHGDGRASGFGCQSSGVIIGAPIAIGILLCIIISASIIYCRKSYRRRLMNLKFTRYLTSNSEESSSMELHSDKLSQHVYSINNHNNLNMAPVFGYELEIDRSDLSRKEIIGRGNFGVVHKAVWSHNDEEYLVAVKSLTGPYTSEYRHEFLAEISLLTFLGDHENILGIVGVCTTQSLDSARENLSPFLVTEYMAYGDLLHFLWKARNPTIGEEDPVYRFTEGSLYKIGQQVACGMKFVRQAKIIHGDLAARNVLVGENLHVKISDFGLANDVYRYGFIKGAIERKVPFKWISPERMSGGQMPITWKSDVWSFGVLLYEMVTLGASPYPGMDQVTIFSKLQSGYRMPQPKSCSVYLYTMMRGCWEWSALDRPCFKQLEKKLRFGNEMKLQHEPLLERIGSGNEIDVSSYERIVEKRRSFSLPSEIIQPEHHIADALNPHECKGDDVTSEKRDGKYKWTHVNPCLT